MTAGLILAAGESRRMGCSKALLRYRGETFADRLVGLFAPHCSPVIVVLGARADEIRAGVRRPATFVVNQEWRRGQTSSLQCGLAAIGLEAEGVLLTLVDHPAVDPATIEALLAPKHPPPAPSAPRPSGNGGSTGALLRIPRYRSRRGHPIWFSRALVPELLAVREPRTAKDVVHAHPDETVFVDLDDPGIVADIDDPAAYRALTGAGV